uniref:Uncharacterized protein n=1 Tax=Tanacetum cinerariifolium TaxID=118510 RepID=A0A699IEE0_TANCI|nr:hypothetical protein [Tanacetum cinerariifolium]
MKVKGFWEAIIKYFKKETRSTRGHDFTLGHCYNILKDHQDEYEEAREHRPLGCDNVKAKKKSSVSSREGSSSFVGLVADKYMSIKSKNRKRCRSNKTPTSN